MVEFNWSWADYEREKRKAERKAERRAERAAAKAAEPDTTETVAPAPPAPKPPAPLHPEMVKAIKGEARDHGLPDPFARGINKPPIPTRLGESSRPSAPPAKPKAPPPGGFVAAFDRIMAAERAKRKALAEQQAQRQRCELCGKMRLGPCDDRGCPIL